MFELKLSDIQRSLNCIKKIKWGKLQNLWKFEQIMFFCRNFLFCLNSWQFNKLLKYKILPNEKMKSKTNIIFVLITFKLKPVFTNCKQYNFYWKPSFNMILKIIGVQNQLAITFGMGLRYQSWENSTLNTRISYYISKLS